MTRFLMTRLGIALVVAVGLTACAESDAPNGPAEPQLSVSSNPTLVECPSTSTLSSLGTVLPTGGVVALGGHRVTLPLGAVLSPTAIEIRDPASQFMMLDLRAGGQEHYQFRAPISVTIDYSRCSRSNIDKGTLSVWLIDPATGALLQNMGGVDDKANHRITFQTDHFSGYALAN